VIRTDIMVSDEEIQSNQIRHQADQPLLDVRFVEVADFVEAGLNVYDQHRLLGSYSGNVSPSIYCLRFHCHP